MRIDNQSKSLPNLNLREPTEGAKRTRHVQSTQERSAVTKHETQPGVSVSTYREQLVAEVKAKIDSGEYFTKESALQVANAILES